MTNSSGQKPLILADLQHWPSLQTAVKPALDRQVSVIATLNAQLVGRRSMLSELRAALRLFTGGLIALQGPPGSGVSSVLAHLATTLPAAFWFADPAGKRGASSLCAQLLARHPRSIPLVAPAADSDPQVIEQLLEELSASLAPTDSQVILIDPPPGSTQPALPRSFSFPATIPPRILVVWGSHDPYDIPYPPDLTFRLPHDDAELSDDQVLLLRQAGCPTEWTNALVAAAQGNFLYLNLASAMLTQQRIGLHELPADLEALHLAWLASLDQNEHNLVLLLAATDDALTTSYLREMGGDAAALARLSGWIGPGPDSGVDGEQSWQLRHWFTRDFLARRQPAELAAIHTRLAVAAAPRHNGEPCGRGFARNAAFGTPTARDQLLPAVTRRTWIKAHARQLGGTRYAADDLAWELRVAAEQHDLPRLVRGAALAGSLTSRAHSLNPEAAVAALELTLQRHERESGLKRVLALVEQLPDGLDKAIVLRQLGEACYQARLRTSAMRLLSRALDLEDQRFPLAWRDQREQFLAALVEAALDLNDDDAALQISGYISHFERRGMAATRIVRWSVEHNKLARAQQVAAAIDHESLAAWCQAEVAVALYRAGEHTAAEEMLARVSVETAGAWAQIELACDEAYSNEDAARARIGRLPSQNQRDRGLSRLAHTLALAAKDGDALTAAEQIVDVETRVTALLDLRLTLDGLVAMLALEQATAAIGALTGPARAPLLAALAAAHAALGRRERSLSIVAQLDEGEERDRALSRVAVAFARQGDDLQAQALAAELSDDDERDWALDEMVRIMAQAGRWQNAEQLAAAIQAPDQRARTLADLAIQQARSAEPLAALQLALTIQLAGERARALTLIAPAVVAAGQTAAALAVAGIASEPRARLITRERDGRRPLLAFANIESRSRYLVAVAGAMAGQAPLSAIRTLIERIPRPLDQARAHLALAAAMARSDPPTAQTELGAALRAAMFGREAALRLLEQAVPVLATLGGSVLLVESAEIVDQVDRINDG